LREAIVMLDACHYFGSGEAQMAGLRSRYDFKGTLITAVVVSLQLTFILPLRLWKDSYA